MGKAPKAPKVAEPIPVPQADDAALIDTRRVVRNQAEDREGSSASLLTPGRGRGVTGSAGTTRKRLGLGAIGY